MFQLALKKNDVRKELRTHFKSEKRYTPQAEEEVRELQKKMQQLENDLDQTQEKLMNANQRLEEKEKALQNVRQTEKHTV